MTLEKLLTSFEDLHEWPDYISFLSRLHKTLQNESPNSRVPPILALCLSPKLPNGVHQKTLSIYEYIVTSGSFKQSPGPWICGLLPLLGHCSIQVKPQLVRLLRTCVDTMDTNSARHLTQPFVCGAFAGLEDENSEVFGGVLGLVDEMRQRVSDDAHFWQNIFMGIVKSPERRPGALAWCTRRLPVFRPVHGDVYGEDALACLVAEPGLIVRAFAAALGDHDIVVVRGFFDLLLTHIPLDSPVYGQHISAKDKQLLVSACCGVTIRKDMSLNRRLWVFLLGQTDRVSYFGHAEKEVVQAIIDTETEKRISGIDHSARSIDIATALVSDKWEIATQIVPKIFGPLLELAYKHKDNERVVAAARGFLDSVDAAYVWASIVESRDYGLVDFVLRTFTLNDHDVGAVHAPLAAAAFLVRLKEEVSSEGLYILEVLFGMVEDKEAKNSDDKCTLSSICSYYAEVLTFPENPPTPPLFSDAQLTSLMISVYISAIEAGCADAAVGTLTALLRKDPHQCHEQLESALRCPNSGAALANAKVLGALRPSPARRGRMLKAVLSSLFGLLCRPVGPFVECVRAICELQASCGAPMVSGGLVSLMSELSVAQRVRVFDTLWTHSAALNSADEVLARPLQLVLDEMPGESAVAFVCAALKNAQASRLLKHLVAPLLEFDFMEAHVVGLEPWHDLAAFAYRLRAISAVLHADKGFREAFGTELAASNKANVIRENGWNASTYQALVVEVVHKFFGMRGMGTEYYECIVDCVEVLRGLGGGDAQVLMSVVDKIEEMKEKVDKSGEMDEKKVDGSEEMKEKVSEEMVNPGNVSFSAHLRSAQICHGSAQVYEADLALCALLDCISHLIQPPPPQKTMVDFLTRGITRASSPQVLHSWLQLLTRTVCVLHDSEFTVLLTLSDCLVQRIGVLFEQVRRGSAAHTDAFFPLFDGMCDLVQIGHSGMRLPGGNFLGNVIQGVFQVESPQLRTSEQNRMYSVLVAVQDAAEVFFRIWRWADGGQSSHIETSTSSLSPTLLYTTNKLKFKARQSLSVLMELEPQDVIETLISRDPVASVKLLAILDGGRASATLPHVLEGVRTRCQQNNTNVLVSVPALCQFAVAYAEQLDADALCEAWPEMARFARECAATAFAAAQPGCLRLVAVAARKMGGRYSVENKKSLKEASEVFVRVLAATKIRKHEKDKNSNEKHDSNSNDDSSGNHVENNDSQDNFSESGQLISALLEIVPTLDTVTGDADKASSAANTILGNLIAPRVGGASQPLLQLLRTIGEHYPTRQWCSVVHEAFMESSFLHKDLSMWWSIVSTWISHERSRMSDLVARITPVAGAAPGNLFNWTEHGEVAAKVHAVRRVCFLLLSQPRDFFAAIVDDIFSQIDTAFAHAPPLYRSELCTLLRAATLRFSESHLRSHWALISQKLVSVLEMVENRAGRKDEKTKKDQKKTDTFSADELSLVLGACKLLDQLLVVGFDEFTLYEWQFVSSGPASVHQLGDALVDKIARIDLGTADTPAQLYRGSRAPVLRVSHIQSVAELRLFFAHLSWVSYERMFGMDDVDYKACESEVVRDITEQRAKRAANN